MLHMPKLHAAVQNPPQNSKYTNAPNKKCCFSNKAVITQSAAEAGTGHAAAFIDAWNIA